MRFFHWLIILMDITLIVILWLYIYDLYIQGPMDGLEYTTHIFHSDEAIPIIGLGILLNTGAIISIIRNARRKRQETIKRKSSLSPHHLEKVAEQEEIKELEEALEGIVARLEELRKATGEEN